MKKLGLLMLCLLLGGCFHEEDLEKDLKQTLQNSSHQEAIDFTTMSKPLYNYYLPKDVGRISSNNLSSIFKKDGTKFIMNFNPNSIVIRDYYYEVDALFAEMRDTSVISSSETGIRFEGTFKKSNGGVHNFSCVVDQLDNGKYFMFLNMEYVYFYTTAYGAELCSLIDTMFKIGQSFTYDADQVVKLYSLKSSSEYLTEDLDRYTSDLPSEGYLTDLIEGEKE